MGILICLYQRLAFSLPYLSLISSLNGRRDAEIIEARFLRALINFYKSSRVNDWVAIGFSA